MTFTFLDYFTSLRNKRSSKTFLLVNSIFNCQVSTLKWSVKLYIQHVQNRTPPQYQAPPPLSMQFCPTHLQEGHLEWSRPVFITSSPLFSSQFFCILFLPLASSLLPSKVSVLLSPPRLLNRLLLSSLTPSYWCQNLKDLAPI